MPDFSRRDFLKAATVGALTTTGLTGREAWGQTPTREVLYNGIRLGSPWPPDNRYFSPDPITPPYLADPPAVIPIDLGRQLFVDDFLIEESSLARTFHKTQYHPGNPVLRPETKWEYRDEYADRTETKPNPAAMPFSDGVFYDPADRLFKMWYMGGYSLNTCLALSNDGISWERPELDVIKGTNIVLTHPRDSSTVWLDHEDRDGGGRFKMAFYNGSAGGLLMFTSSDGVHWRQVGKSINRGDRSTFFWNPFRQVWVFSLRDDINGNERHRRYYESRDFATARWNAGEPPLWIGADHRDRWRPEYNSPPELYNLDCVAYESIVLGLFTIWHGEHKYREKPNDISVGYSRDGFHWSRPDREAFIGVSETEGDWNWANVQSAGGCCLTVGDRLYFYVSGRQGEPGTNRPGVCATGLATLRRDGFASLSDDVRTPQPVRARQSPPGSVTTRPLRFSGGNLFVNAAVTGQMRVEVLDREGRVIEPFSAAKAVPVTGDATRIPVSWQSGASLKSLAGEIVRFRFILTRGRLYSFWVSASATGASGGYVAAGGPGFRAGRDV
ncbi:MAG: twin-arginine translocation signal domain-containing protein [Acidobacteriota bacterium]|nr:twin-arginine translocation signal domain-containing protein [Acidobacteriota bacterium]